MIIPIAKRRSALHHIGRYRHGELWTRTTWHTFAVKLLYVIPLVTAPALDAVSFLIFGAAALAKRGAACFKYLGCVIFRLLGVITFLPFRGGHARSARQVPYLQPSRSASRAPSLSAEKALAELERAAGFEPAIFGLEGRCTAAVRYPQAVVSASAIGTSASLIASTKW